MGQVTVMARWRKEGSANFGESSGMRGKNSRNGSGEIFIADSSQLQIG